MKYFKHAMMPEGGTEEEVMLERLSGNEEDQEQDEWIFSWRWRLHDLVMTIIARNTTT